MQRKNGDGRRRMWAERGGKVSLEVVIPQVKFCRLCGSKPFEKRGLEEHVQKDCGQGEPNVSGELRVTGQGV